MKMFIEVWSDIACPFCYIGKRNLENALKELSEEIPVVWRSFELDPNAPKTSSVDNATRLAQKYGKSLDWARGMNAQVTERAQSVGLHLELDRVVATNTFDTFSYVMQFINGGLPNIFPGCAGSPDLSPAKLVRNMRPHVSGDS